MNDKNKANPLQDKDLELDETKANEANNGLPETPVVTQSKEIPGQMRIINEQAEKIKKLQELLDARIPATPSPDIDTLKTQVDLLTKLVTNQQQSMVTLSAGAGKRQLYRQPVETDQQEQFVTFTARLVMFMVIGYVDNKGLERIAPFKPIVFSYAASDIRKDGKEDDIINFCQYSTNLKPEIEFLRNSPQYGIAFAETMNDAASFDTKTMEFRIQAIQNINPLSAESVMSLAGNYKIPKYMERSVNDLKQMLIQILADEYQEQQRSLDNTRKERLLVTQLSD
jgi:hypothetical protein